MFSFIRHVNGDLIFSNKSRRIVHQFIYPFFFIFFEFRQNQLPNPPRGAFAIGPFHFSIIPHPLEAADLNMIVENLFFHLKTTTFPQFKCNTKRDKRKQALEISQ